MKIAFLILCHKNPMQINYLIDMLDDKDVDFYLHVDKKSNIINEIKKKTIFLNLHNQQVDEILKCFYFVNTDKTEIAIFNFDIYLQNVGI
ncbi:hypothetical protein [Thomasclavelia cocleata]|uniref:hypothetical protein n=1 Tax=Thomasclavelia cocleata TaxID=69824 RepID=UPI00242E6DBA|nr:hypothetical protein [Thomasclavelia cocleata]